MMRSQTEITSPNETSSQSVVVHRTHMHIRVGAVCSWELDGYEKISSPICT